MYVLQINKFIHCFNFTHTSLVNMLDPANMQIQPNLNKIHTWKWLNYFQSIKNMNICPFYIEIGGVRHYGIGWPPQSYENTIEVRKMILYRIQIQIISFNVHSDSGGCGWLHGCRA